MHFFTIISGITESNAFYYQEKHQQRYCLHQCYHNCFKLYEIEHHLQNCFSLNQIAYKIKYYVF